MSVSATWQQRHLAVSGQRCPSEEVWDGMGGVVLLAVVVLLVILDAGGGGVCKVADHRC